MLDFEVDKTHDTPTGASSGVSTRIRLRLNPENSRTNPGRRRLLKSIKQPFAFAQHSMRTRSKLRGMYLYVIHDLTLFRQSKSTIYIGTLLSSDLDYVGIQKHHANSVVPHRKNYHSGLIKEEHKLTREQRLENRALSRRRIVIEHINRRLKIFKILSERYRNRGRRFGLHFNLIYAIYNYEYVTHKIEKDSPLP